MKSLLEKTLSFIAEFRDQFEEMPCSNDFLDDYSWNLKQGLAQAESLTPDQKRHLLTKAADLLKIISAEWDKCEVVLGNNLRLAMVERLQANIRETIRGLNKAPVTCSRANGRYVSGH